MTDPNDTVIVLSLNGPPAVDPPTLTQGSDSPFLLDYESASTTGKAIKRFNREGKFHIAKWTGPSDTIRWRLLISQPGPYQVRVHYAAPDQSRGNKYVIHLGTQSISGVVEPTGAGYHYKSFDLGKINIGKSGLATFEIKPAQEYSHNLMFFQSIELTPVGVVMVD
jgi:alpha-L-fucosidase